MFGTDTRNLIDPSFLSCCRSKGYRPLGETPNFESMYIYVPNPLISQHTIVLTLMIMSPSLAQDYVIISHTYLARRDSIEDKSTFSETFVARSVTV